MVIDGRKNNPKHFERRWNVIFFFIFHFLGFVALCITYISLSRELRRECGTRPRTCLFFGAREKRKEKKTPWWTCQQHSFLRSHFDWQLSIWLDIYYRYLDFYMRLLYDPGQRFFFLRHEKKSRLIPFFCYQKIRSVEFLLALVFLWNVSLWHSPVSKQFGWKWRHLFYFFPNYYFGG